MWPMYEVGERDASLLISPYATALSSALFVLILQPLCAAVLVYVFTLADTFCRAAFRFTLARC